MRDSVAATDQQSGLRLLFGLSTYSALSAGVVFDTVRNLRLPFTSFKMTEMVDLIRQMQRFALPDYLVFITMLILCILIGIYFGFAQKSSSETEYLMGGRNMMIFPIALSLIARYRRFSLNIMTSK